MTTGRTHRSAPLRRRQPGGFRRLRLCTLGQPHLAEGDRILAIPIVVRLPARPARMFIGTLADAGRVPPGPDLRPEA